jgi:hypothetical protein
VFTLLNRHIRVTDGGIPAAVTAGCQTRAENAVLRMGARSSVLITSTSAGIDRTRHCCHQAMSA